MRAIGQRCRAPCANLPSFCGNQSFDATPRVLLSQQSYTVINRPTPAFSVKESGLLLPYLQHALRSLSSKRQTLQEGHMARHTDEEKIKAIATYIERNPGTRPADIAKALDLPRSSITRALPALEDARRLISEDRRGGLWPFRR